MMDAVSDPHPVDEDPEQCIGDEIQDPWDDPAQTDWPGPDESPTADPATEQEPTS